MFQQIPRAAAVQGAFAGFPAQLVNSGQKRRKDIGVLTQGKGHRIDVLGGDLIEAAPGQAAIGEALEEIHHIGGQIEIDPADLVFHHAIAAQQQDDDGVGRSRNDLNALDKEALAGDGGGNGKAAGFLGQHPGGAFQHAVGVGVAVIEQGVNLAAGGVLQRLRLHQVIEVVAQTAVSGDASGGGMGLLDVALLAEVGQVIADGSGGDSLLQHGGDHLGADGLAGADVAFHHAGEDPAFSRIQLHIAPSFLALTHFEC